MRGELVSLENASPIPIPQRAQNLSEAFGVALRHVCLALMEAGVHDRDFISPGGAGGTRIEQALIALWQAHHRTATFWQGQCERLTRQLRKALACDGLSDEDREHILTALFGRQQTRDGKVLSEPEAQLLQDYRAMDPGGRQMLRTLCQRLASATVQTGEDRS